MKKCLLIPGLVFWIFTVSGQPVKPANNWYIGVAYSQEIVVNGYVRVREFDLEGDKMTFKELGMSSYPAVKLQLGKQLSLNRKILFSYENFYLNGHSVFNRNIAYNGTIINARNGISVSPTRYFRLRGDYAWKPFIFRKFSMQIVTGLVYDHITFYLDGTVAENSPRSEVYESFGKQALPYPVGGMLLKFPFSEKAWIQLEAEGTYIPKFKSFFNEGGTMSLQYSTLLSDAAYIRKWKHWT